MDCGGYYRSRQPLRFHRPSLIMTKLLASLGKWLLDTFGEKLPEPKRQFIPVIDRQIINAATQAVLDAALMDASGEYKRHQAYSKLVKQFPEESRNILSIAIELAVWSTK